MATNNAPKHDFAPAWLKIPNQENSKPPGSKQGKRYPPGPNGKFRHHSVDGDYFAYTYGPYGYGYDNYNGYGYEKYGSYYNSQPSLFRSPPQRDSKYQHPNARYGPGQPVNGGYPSYYELGPPYDYYTDSYYNNYPGRSSSKRTSYEKEGRSNSKEEKEKDRERKGKDGEKDKPFNDDFPSLNGGVDRQNTNGSKQTNGTGVWDNPPLGKGGSAKSGEDGSDASQPKGQSNTTIYKNLVPNKSTIPRRPGRMNGSYSRDTVPFGVKPSTPTTAQAPGVSKEGSGPSPTPPIDILNTQFVTQPKTLADKKSHFWKALRQEDEKLGVEKKMEGQKPSDRDLVNGLDSLDLDENDTDMLSSSLEAEQRLLREMGWNEADEEEYEITEDDMKQFQSNCKQAQQSRNGFVRALPKTWSPKHIPIYTPDVQELNETLSSSDSESDTEPRN